MASAVRSAAVMIALGQAGFAVTQEHVPQARLQGQVVDARGAPVTAADVRVERHGEVVGRSASDALGLFFVRELPFDPLVVHASTNDLAGAVRVEFEAGTRGFVRVRTFPTRAVRVRVQHADGHPAAGIEVVAAPDERGDLPLVVARAATDEEGRCVLRGVPIGEVVVRAHVPGIVVAETAVRGADDQDALVVLDGEPVRRLAFELHGASPEQLRTARLVLHYERRRRAVALPSHLERLAVTAGRTTIDDLPDGLRVHAAVDGLPGTAIEPAVDFVPAFASDWKLAFQVLPAGEGRLRGRLVDAQGNGLPQRRFVCQPASAPGTWFGATWGVSAADGSFTVQPAVGPGEQFMLRLVDAHSIVEGDESRDMGRVWSYVARHDAAAGHVVRCVTARTVRGRIVAAGVPCAGAEVVATWRSSRGSDELVARALSDVDGRYELTLPEGVAVHVAAMAPAGFGAQPELVRAVGGELELPDLVLAAVGLIRGRATRADGSPATGMFVELVSTRTSSWSTTGWTLSDRDGRFWFPGVPPGRYRLSHSRTRGPLVIVDGGAPTEVDLRTER